jgi:hypothetical protein
VLPTAAVGDTFLLIFTRPAHGPAVLDLVATLNSFVQDYCARQKVGANHMNYFVLKQLPVLPPRCFRSQAPWSGDLPVRAWLTPRLLELKYTSDELAPLAEGCSSEGTAFAGDDSRRFEIRCELDVAFFHLYLQAENDGQWCMVEGETSEQLASLKMKLRDNSLSATCSPRSAATLH